ncbi:hypothetical protein FACS189451_08820 [Bacteroidia bacterium]|nr:hypothetical protein FACS189451_08820 [Bacteroidia bacterium]
MLIKWAKRGSGLFFPNWNKMNREHLRKSSFYPDMTTFYGKFSYYFLLAWTIGEIILVLYLLFKC